MEKMYKYTMIDLILIISLLIALLCSIIILIEVFYYRNHSYKKTFSSWQAPMIFAMLIDLYLIYEK